MTCQPFTLLLDILLKGQRVGASIVQSATWRAPHLMLIKYDKPL
jgi:hypothetical protein